MLETIECRRGEHTRHNWARERRSRTGTFGRGSVDRGLAHLGDQCRRRSWRTRRSRTGTLDLHTNHGHPQRQVCACQKECVSCRVCVPIHRSSARLLLRWSSRMGCPFAWAVHSQGLSIRKAADRLGISFHTLDNWIRRGRPKRTVQVPSGPPKTLAEAEARVRSLEADVRRLTLEREILKKAAAYFAKEQS